MLKYIYIYLFISYLCIQWLRYQALEPGTLGTECVFQGGQNSPRENDQQKTVIDQITQE